MSRGRRGGEAPQPGLNPVAGLPAAALFFRAVGMDLIDFEPSWDRRRASAARASLPPAWLRPAGAHAHPARALHDLVRPDARATARRRHGRRELRRQPRRPFPVHGDGARTSREAAAPATPWSCSPWGPVKRLELAESVARSTYMAVSRRRPAVRAPASRLAFLRELGGSRAGSVPLRPRAQVERSANRSPR